MKKKRKKTGMTRFLAGYGLGFFRWLAGFHCFEGGEKGGVRLSYRKLIRHSGRVLLWTFAVLGFYRLFAWYVGWLFQATDTEKTTAFLVKAVIFLYLRVFWPSVFPRLLPGLKRFFCPQCYQRQTFRFLPFSPQYGLGVTYLCRYCGCLVDGWGSQVFYPASFSMRKMAPGLGRTLPAVILAMAAGAFLLRAFLGWM